MTRRTVLHTSSLFLFLLLFCRKFCEAFRGRYTRDAEFSRKYEIVIPRKVKSDGTFVSHRIPHHFERSFYKDRKCTDADPADVLHYRLQIENQEHHLELHPNLRLVSPGAVIEEHRSQIRGRTGNKNFMDDIKLQRMHDAQCHYRGYVRNHTENSAVSTCSGLTGYIRTKRSLYAIEPVDDYDFTKEQEHPHILYKMKPNDSDDLRTLCNVTGNVTKAVAKRAFKSQRSHSNKKCKPCTLELLLVLDKTFLDYRRGFDVENYALTIINMAAGLLHDSSLGTPVDLSIVRIIRMEVEDEEMNLSSNKDADRTLKYFQEWQGMMNPGDDSHPNHHDSALLITKMDICPSPSLCGFTGTSTIAATCDPLTSAAIVTDIGLQTGYHVAHQIGHTLGMSHDVQEENGCVGVIHHRNGYVETTVMHPGSLYLAKKWSKCSKNYLRSYIEAGLGTCLEDEPKDHNFPLINLLPGVMYNADDQCRLLYRQDSRQCNMGITCETLRCTVPGKGCVSTNQPPAEGTPCGEKRWCYEMKCLMVGNRPGVTDGGWGAWSEWSRCSRSCGSGVASSVRRCNSPSPSNGGEYCRGDRKRHKICATNPCKIDEPSFRDVQCSEFNDWTFPEDGRIHRWISYNLPENLRASEDPCALYCLSETDTVASLRPKVVDGTTCYKGIRDICIGGVCREIPCDLNMESDAIEDVCGVCKGNGTSCRLKEGTVTFQEGSSAKKVIDVPADSMNIRVEETLPTKSRIIVQTSDGKTLMDGTRLGMFEAPGTKAWLGMIRPRQEALNIPGPVTEDLLVLILPKENVTVKYSLGLKEESPRKPVFSWNFLDWEKCSAKCGPGEQISKPRCVERVAGLVDETYCKRIPRPEAKIRPCFQAPCLPRWLIGDWQGCASCTPGCEKRRPVKCVRPVGHAEQDVDIIADSYCQGPKPKEQESCGARGRRDDVLTRERRNKSVYYTAVQAKRRDLLSRESRDVDDRPRGFGNDRRGPRDKEPRKSTRSLLGKRSQKNSKRDEEDTYEVKKGEMVIDNDDIKNLTLTIILERDDEDKVMNFPKNFQPQPPKNCTEYTLVGMDAVRYIQMIQEHERQSPKVSSIR